MMKKFLIAVLGITLFFQCTGQGESVQYKDQKYIYITAFIDEEFFIEVKKGMADAASLLGVKCIFFGTKDADILALNHIIKIVHLIIRFL
jgi:ABC-type sugar transport system substrate-binding protein